MQKGILHQINLSKGGVPKLPVPEAQLTKDRVIGDDWDWSRYKIQVNGKPGGHGGKDQAVCLFSFENIVKLREQGYPVFPGALGENFTTEGLDYRQIRIGDIYQVGSEVQIQITKPRQPCGTIRTVYSPQAGRGQGLEAAMWDARVKRGDVSSQLWGMSGFYARVLIEGKVSKNDLIRKI